VGASALAVMAAATAHRAIFMFGVLLVMVQRYPKQQMSFLGQPKRSLAHPTQALSIART
jgi:hypothetical protein